MDNIPEREQPKPERVIKLGEEFQMFDPKYTNISLHPRFNVNRFYSKIKLNIEDISIPIRNAALASRTAKSDAITPFDPALGYQIDSEDLDLERRIAKMKRLGKELEQNIDFAKAPLFLEVGIDRFLLRELDLNKEDEELVGRGFYEFPPETLGILRRLRIQVSFPSSRFEARAWETSLDLGEISFEDFYPIHAGHSGPLPASETVFPPAEEGFTLFLPSDPEKLAQIRARFVMVEEQPKEA